MIIADRLIESLSPNDKRIQEIGNFLVIRP